MSAGGALQTVIASALNSMSDLSGVFDGPPARAIYPYAAIDATTESDWSHKSGAGREVMVGITLWDDQPVRLMRRRVLRDVAGPWAAAVDFRARMLAAA